MTEEGTEPPAALGPLARARLDDLLAELLARVGDVMDTQDRLRGLLDAVVGIAGDLDLDSVLQRIVRVACQLADAQYGALGVLGSGSDRRLTAFVTHGLTDDQRTRIGELPRGHGILGVIIDSPEPLRLDHLGKHGRSYGFPANHPPMETVLGVPVRIREKVFGNLYLTEKRTEGGFTRDDEEIVVALAAAAGVAIENARLYEEAARRQRWLEAAADVTAALRGGMTQDDALAFTANRTREVADADLAAMLLRHEGGRLLVEAASGTSAAAALAMNVPVVDTVVGGVLAGGECAVLTDLTGNEGLAALGLAEAPGWPHLGSVALLPLGSAKPAAGVLLLGWSPDHDDSFRAIDLGLPMSYAEQAGLALQVAQAQEDRGRLAVFEDRDRIGRDLHDLVIQRLFGIGLTLENAVRLTNRPEIAERITGAVDDIDATIKDIRRTIFELSAPSGSSDFRSALGEEVAASVTSLGFTPRLRTSGPVDTAVTPELRPHLLAVLREALSNVARHAQATKADIGLDVGTELVLTVADDGVGVPGGGRRSGLQNMAERAESLDGSFELRGGPGRGTEVVWRVPAG